MSLNLACVIIAVIMRDYKCLPGLLVWKPFASSHLLKTVRVVWRPRRSIIAFFDVQNMYIAQLQVGVQSSVREIY